MPASAFALNLPPGFQAKPLDIPRSGEGPHDYKDGLQFPTALDFSPDGKMFVAERNGRVKVFDSVDDETPTLAADLTREVMARGDRGLLGLKLDPEFPARPYLYLAYTHDAPIGGEAPSVPDDPSGADFCDEGAPYTDCLASGRIVQIEVDPDTGVAQDEVVDPPQNVLVEDWCIQFMTHSIGDIEFDSEGALLAGGGDGARWESADNGQFANPCGDPSLAGGSLRSQDLRGSGDPTGYDGSIIRIDRDTGEPMPENPLIESTDADARRILAYGLRNPFRFELRPGTGELYVGDVGWYSWDELNRTNSPLAPGQSAVNFGWPCFEGIGHPFEWNQLAENGQAPLCDSLYKEPPGAATGPIFQYFHGSSGIFPGDTCDPGFGSSITGLAFYTPEGASAENVFPASYEGSLLLADASRGCIWTMFAGADGLPDPATIANFATPGPSDTFTPVDLTFGPDGALYVPNFFDNSIVRIRSFADGQPPVAGLEADNLFGPNPLQVKFDASASVDPDSGKLDYSWDLDGDGSFGDAPNQDQVQDEYTEDQNVTVSVRVTDDKGNVDESHLTVYPGDAGPPEPKDVKVEKPEWAVGDPISFSATATDPDGETPRLDWDLTIKHCPSACHSHPLTSFTNVAGGQITAPPHEHPSHLVITLTARDERGLATRVTEELFPRIVAVEMTSSPPGVSLAFNGQSGPSPFSGQLIAGSNANISAPESEVVGGVKYVFDGWSDGGARAHAISPTESTKLMASYRQADPESPGPVPPVTPQPNPSSPTELLKLRLQSKPKGISLQVGSQKRKAPFDLEFGLTEGRWITAPPRATLDGRRLHFRRWSNGAGRRQWVTAGQSKMLCAVYGLDRDHRRAR